MWLLAGILSCAVIAIHFIWVRKFLRAIESKDTELRLILEAHGAEIILAEQQRQMLWNSMVEGLLLLDKTGRILLANNALKKLFDITSDIHGKTIIEAFRNHRLASLADRLSVEREIINFEIELFEIQPRWFQINAVSTTDDQNTITGFILVFHDLTRLRELENTRREFVANVSHELRTPLSMIRGYVETLLDGAKDNPEVAEKFLKTIERHTDRLTFLIEDLLTISKLESGRGFLNPHRGEMNLVINKVIRDLQGRADDRQVTLENLSSSSEISVFADLDRLEQVFWNLIDNAIKYGSSPGTVKIEAEEKNGEIIVSVKNGGAGIPVDLQTRVFERFFREDKSRSGDRGGSGLGLAIVKHVVQSHDGRVWIESAPGEGTHFFFTLPGVDSSD